MEITELLHRWKLGDKDAEQALVESLYPELKKIVHNQRFSLNLETFATQTTALVAEVYIRLNQRNLDFANRAHFKAVASNVVRGLLIDDLRKRKASKRGGDVTHTSPDAIDRVAGGDDITFSWIDLGQALIALEANDQFHARVVQYRVFGGMTAEEIASTCEVSTATVGRAWRFARAWLKTHLHKAH